MIHRRLVGIDLVIASAHASTTARARSWPNSRRGPPPRADLEPAALAGTPAGNCLKVVIEPGGPAWLPIAVFFITRGHAVFRVSSAKVADLRRFFYGHTKTYGTDVHTLARLTVVDPEGLQLLVLPGAKRSALDRRVRTWDRLTHAARSTSTASRTWSASCCP